MSEETEFMMNIDETVETEPVFCDSCGVDMRYGTNTSHQGVQVESADTAPEKLKELLINEFGKASIGVCTACIFRALGVKPCKEFQEEKPKNLEYNYRWRGHSLERYDSKDNSNI